MKDAAIHIHWFSIRPASVFAFSLMLGVSSAIASFPLIEQNKPLGVVRGEEATIVFKGLRLGDAYDAIADQPGVEIIEVKAINGKQVSVKLKTDAALSPGLYPIRVVTRTGVSNIKLIGVGSMPITNEVEPNNSFDSPQKVDWDHSRKCFGTTIEGIAGREDVDFYQFDLKAGQRLTAEIEGIRLSYTINNRNILDPFIAILDEGRFEVASSDDSALLAQDGVCSFVAPKDGVYSVMVRDSSFVGGPICGYRLHVGSFPRPVAAVPVATKPGTESGKSLTAELISIDGSRSEATVDLPSTLLPTVPQQSSTGHVRVTDRWGVTTEDETGISPSPNWIRVNDLKMITEVEPNDSFRKPQIAEAPAAFCGVIEKPGDYDCFAFQAKKGDKFRAQCFAREPFRSPLDAVMNVFGPNSKSLSSADDIGTAKDPSIEFTCPVDGQYTLRIFDHLRGGSELHQYRVELTKAVPSFSIGLKETRRDNATVAAVPIGAHTAVMAQVTRAGYNGEIELTVDGLPDGVTAKLFPIPAGRSEIPVLLTASADADYSSSLFRVHGTASEKKSGDRSVASLPMSQLHKIVLGQNRRMMFGYRTDFAAAAVTEPPPFQIELVQPQTPIVRRGSKNLKVKIIRDEGFEDQVQLRTLYNPPGIAVNNSRKIEKGKVEADIPMTANGGAAIGKWPIILVATYKGRFGNIAFSSQAIMLDVQAEYFDFEFPRVAAELGTEAIVSVGLNIKRDLPENVEIELAGLPAGVTSPSPKQAVTSETKTLSFPIVLSKDAKPGKHKTLVCIARAKIGDEVVVQTNGTGELRIDKPLPPKTNAKKVQAKKVSKQKAKPKQAKALSRLEQLRQMQEQE
ncbi:putative subtilase-type serine protease precursor [Rubripirellula obstinata]|uniref:Putative subtilase-type serine protease n=1 Tax=Rubripirellula obstinata TaxID=406547 RepID=A0A5B1CG12_9BACT|nr:PPC domain-containing protein [Rubripirellula obstinata]KAA1258865.1 putative subtilase-type serine protease precursor [Rubripirellula obstinata]